MGLLGKIKNIFYDEEIVDVEEEKVEKTVKKEESRPRIEEITPPVKEREVKREEPSTIRSEKREEESKPSSLSRIQSEREIFRNEPTFKFPLLDEEDSEEEYEQPKIKTRSNILDIDRYTPAPPKKTLEKPVEKKVEKPDGVFKPSPVISPVYGILDKNYKKEEIIERKDSASTYRPGKGENNYDYVRRKAYGTLEDELENTLSRINSEELEKVAEPQTDTEKEKSIEDLLSEINSNANVPISELEERIKDEIEAEDDDDTEITQEIYYKKETRYKEPEYKEEELESQDELEETPRNRTIEDIGDKTLEHDLFNLIDSMYEDKEEE